MTEHLAQNRIADFHAPALGERADFIVEQAAVQKRQIAKIKMREIGIVGGKFDEKRPQELVVKRNAIAVGGVVAIEGGNQIIALPVQPAFALDEIEKQQAAQKRLRFAVGIGVFPAFVAVEDVFGNQLERLAEIRETFLVEFFDGKRLGQISEPGGGGQTAKTLGSGAAGFARAEHVGEPARGGLLGP